MISSIGEIIVFEHYFYLSNNPIGLFDRQFTKLSYKRGFMANYNELPVYKACYDLLLEIFNFTKNFTR